MNELFNILTRPSSLPTSTINKIKENQFVQNTPQYNHNRGKIQNNNTSNNNNMNVEMNTILGRNGIYNEIKNILNSFEHNHKTLNFKKGIYIYGSPGCGKTRFVIELLNSLNYDIIKYDAGDVRNKSLIDTITCNNISNRNVLHLMNGSIKKIAIVMDEIDGMNNGDKGGITSLIKLIRQKKTKKQKSESVTLNPIICIGNYYIDKKIKELMKVCNVFKLDNPTTQQVETIIERTIHTPISNSLKMKILDYVQGDLVKLNFIINLHKKNPELLNEEILTAIFMMKSYNYDAKKITHSLINSSILLEQHTDFMNETDRTIVSLLYHENIIDALMGKYKDSFKENIGGTGGVVKDHDAGFLLCSDERSKGAHIVSDCKEDDKIYRDINIPTLWSSTTPPDFSISLQPLPGIFDICVDSDEERPKGAPKDSVIVDSVIVDRVIVDSIIDDIYNPLECKEPKAKKSKTKEPKTKEPKTKEPKTKEPKTKEPKMNKTKTSKSHTKEPILIDINGTTPTNSSDIDLKEQIVEIRSISPEEMVHISHSEGYILPERERIEKSGGVAEGHDVGFLLYCEERPKGARRDIKKPEERLKGPDSIMKYPPSNNNIPTSWSSTTPPEYKRNPAISLIGGEAPGDPPSSASYLRVGAAYPKSSIRSIPGFINIDMMCDFYMKTMDNICYADYIDRITFQNQIWVFNEMSSLIKTFYNNYLYHQIFPRSCGKFDPEEVRFTKVLTKYSTEYNNQLFIYNFCQELNMDKRDMKAFFQELRLLHGKNFYNQTDKLNQVMELFETLNISKLDVKRMYRFLDKNVKILGELSNDMDENDEDVDDLGVYDE